MEDYPKTVAELEERFATEEACEEYLFALRWPKGFVCPRCGGSKAWKTKRGLYVCVVCGHQASVKAGTIFERSRLSLRQWFRAIWWVVSQKNGASAKGVQRVLGLGSYETAWTWLHKLPRAMVRPGRERLTGTVEVDEAYVGARKVRGKRGRGAGGKSLVLIACEQRGSRIGRIRLQRIRSADGLILAEAVSDMVEAGSTVKTDGWKGYRMLDVLGYNHIEVREDSEIGDGLLPSCHRVAALLKRWLAGTHQGAVSPEHLEYYLDEYTFRFNRRTSRSRGKLFYRLLQHATALEPTTYSQLIRHANRGPKHNI